MKRLLFLLAGLLCCAAAGAQDIILLRNADEVKATVTEITDSQILYKVWGGSDAVLSIPRAEVFSVTYQNGEKEFFMEDRAIGKTAVAVDYPWPEVSRSYRPGEMFDENGLRGLVISVTDEGRHGLLLSLDCSKATWSRTVGENRCVEVAIGTTDSNDGWINRQTWARLVVTGALETDDHPAFAGCEELGLGWYLPAEQELGGLWALLNLDMTQSLGLGALSRAHKRFKELIEPYGGDTGGLIYFMMLWSSTEESASNAYLCTGRNFSRAKPVRAGMAKWEKFCVRAVHKF